MAYRGLKTNKFLLLFLVGKQILSLWCPLLQVCFFRVEILHNLSLPSNIQMDVFICATSTSLFSVFKVRRVSVITGIATVQEVFG